MVDQVSKLPLDLWAKVFEHIMPTPASVGSDWSAGALAQAALWHLPLVCKTFHNTFAAHPELGCCVFLSLIRQSASNSGAGTLSPVPWLQPRAEAVRALHAEVSTVENPEHLQAVTITSPMLLAVSEQNMGPTSGLNILTSFTSLTACCLSASPAVFRASEQICLAPLQGLHHLRKLSLQHCDHSCLAAVSCLTSLHLVQASSCLTERMQPNVQYCAFASTLVQLRMTMSLLARLHPRGLLGCTALQSLKIEGECDISAEDEEDIFDVTELHPIFDPHPWGGQWHGPKDCSPLVKLTEVDLSINSDEKDDGMNLAAIGSLPNLQSLHVLCPQPYMRHDLSVPHLSQLTKLCISARTGFLPFVWNLDCVALKNLQHLEIGGPLEVRSTLLGLLSLLQLHHVDVSSAEPVDEASQSVLEILAQLFRDNRPNVSFQMVLNTL